MIIPEIKKILYATDLSQTARYCFRYAACIANRHGAAITILHVQEPPTGYTQDTYDLSSYIGAEKWEEILKRQEEETVEEMKARIEKFREDVAAEDASFSFTVDGFVVKSGNPVEEILLQAHTGEFDLVVMGAHGRGTLADAMMGSTARRVTRRAEIPVLVVRLPS